MPEVFGRLAMRLGRGAEACAFARLYDARAHDGYDQDAVDEVLDHCD